MEEFLRKVFPKEHKRRDEGKCPFCGEVIIPQDFRDPKSFREYEISGIY